MHITAKQLTICQKFRLQEWHSVEWVQNKDLAPKYGILTLNTSKSFNPMIDKYHNEG